MHRHPGGYPGPMADIFDVIADPTRREVLRRLLELSRDRGADGGTGEISVGHLVTELGLSQPTVSKHLKTLREHDLVLVRDEGQHRYYRLEPAALGTVGEWVAPFLDAAEADAMAGAAVDADDHAAYRAWAGADVGDRVGRAAAVTAHTALSVLHAAQDLVGDRRTAR